MQSLIKMHNLRQILSFISVGFLATIIDLSLYIFLFQIINIPATIASSISFILSAFFNFICNNAFTFQMNNKSLAQKIFTFYLIAMGGLLINYSLIGLLVNNDVNFIVAKIIVVSIVVLYNYTLHSQITFRTIR